MNHTGTFYSQRICLFPDKFERLYKYEEIPHRQTHTIIYARYVDYTQKIEVCRLYLK